MKKNTFKPVFVPTAYSSRTMLWYLAIVAFFASVMWLYCAFDSLAASKKRLAGPVESVVETRYFRASLPPGWKRFAKDDGSVAVFKKADAEIPMMFFSAQSRPGYAYRALDMNTAIGLDIVAASIKAVRPEGLSEVASTAPVGRETLTVMPGIYGMHAIFEIGDFSGESVVFYAGDVRYVVWGLWPDGDAESGAEINRCIRHLAECFSIPETREHIYRPVIDSGSITAARNEEIHRKVEREKALWRLFAARADTEPEVALMPAISHYRTVLTLLSSIRQEHIELSTEDFSRYKKLLEERRRDVDEWFVVLEKAVAMRDWEKARAQAKWIISHATLTGELMDVGRATEILEEKIPAEDK